MPTDSAPDSSGTSPTAKPEFRGQLADSLPVDLKSRRKTVIIIGVEDHIFRDIKSGDEPRPLAVLGNMRDAKLVSRANRRVGDVLFFENYRAAIRTSKPG